MQRKQVWLGLTAALLNASLVLGQGVGPLPGGQPNGYSGYPMSSYPAPLPNGYPPMLPGMPPGPMSYGPTLPPGFAAPMMPYSPNPFGPPTHPGAVVPGMPLEVIMGPDGRPAYIRTPPGAPQRILPPTDPLPPLGAAAPREVRPPAKETPTRKDMGPASLHAEPYSVYEGVPSIPISRDEPMVVYEGPRYFAEARQDGSRVWVQANYVHWWVRRNNFPPLVTTGDPANPAAGTLGAADTGILLEGQIGPKEFSGILGTLGIWLDPERFTSLEVTGLWLGDLTRDYRFASDATGTRPLSIPLRSPEAEGIFVIAQPGVVAGSTALSTRMAFHGAELNFGCNVMRVDCWTFDYLLGARYLYLNESIAMSHNLTTLVDGALSFPEIGALPAGSSLALRDSFDLTNRFYGGQLGIRLNWSAYRFDVGMTAKLGLGATSHVASIDGSTTLNPASAAPVRVNGGILAQPSNMGRFSDADFSIVPECNLTAGFQVTRNVRVLVGYAFLYWNNVERGADQIDRRLNPARSPTSAVFDSASGGPPFFPAARADFWIHGLNVGFELKF